MKYIIGFDHLSVVKRDDRVGVQQKTWWGQLAQKPASQRKLLCRDSQQTNCSGFNTPVTTFLLTHGKGKQEVNGTTLNSASLIMSCNIYTLEEQIFHTSKNDFLFFFQNKEL